MDKSHAIIMFEKIFLSHPSASRALDGYVGAREEEGAPGGCV